MHLPNIMQQSKHYSYVQSQKPAVTGCFNGQHRDQTVDRNTEQPFSGLTHAQKALNFDFSRNLKVVCTVTGILHIKKTVGKSIKKLI